MAKRKSLGAREIDAKRLMAKQPRSPQEEYIIGKDAPLRIELEKRLSMMPARDKVAEYQAAKIIVAEAAADNILRSAGFIADSKDSFEYFKSLLHDLLLLRKGSPERKETFAQLIERLRNRRIAAGMFTREGQTDKEVAHMDLVAANMLIKKTKEKMDEIFFRSPGLLPKGWKERGN